MLTFPGCREENHFKRAKEEDTGIWNNCPLDQRKHVCKWRRRHRQFDLGEKKSQIILGRWEMSSLLRSGVTNINHGLVLSGDQSLPPTDTNVRKDHFLRLLNEIVFSKPQTRGWYHLFGCWTKSVLILTGILALFWLFQGIINSLYPHFS